MEKEQTPEKEKTLQEVREEARLVENGMMRANFNFIHLKKERLHLAEQALHLAGKEFFAKYGVKDWEVRRDYLKLVESVVFTGSYYVGTLGIMVDLTNIWPRNPEERISLTGGYNWSRKTVSGLIDPDFMHLCMLTPRIVEAFLILEEIPDCRDRTFLFSPKVVSWGEDPSPYWEIDGYTAYLVDENRGDVMI